MVHLAFAEWARQWARDGRPGGLTLPELAALVPCMSIRARPSAGFWNTRSGTW